MTSKVFFAFLVVVTYGSLVLLSLAAPATQDKGSDQEGHGRALQGGIVGLLYRIYRIPRTVKGGQKVYEFVNWTRNQAHEYLDGQCFAYCRTPATTPSGCKCDVSTINKQPQDLQCKDFQRYCCDDIRFLLVCQECCKGPRPLSRP